MRKTPGVGSISAVIQVCGGGVAKGTNSHPKYYNAFTVSMQDNKWNYPLRMTCGVTPPRLSGVTPQALYMGFIDL